VTQARRLRILFFCTGNSCRSQMADAWARHLRRDRIEAYSAGLRASEIDPVVMNLMAAAGVDMSSQWSKDLAAVRDVDFDWMITLCGPAHEACAAFPPGVPVVHRPFDDPPELAAGAETEEEAFRHYIRIRDEIRAFVETLPDALNHRETSSRRDPWQRRWRAR